jgi:hypothetical protein
VDKFREIEDTVEGFIKERCERDADIRPGQYYGKLVPWPD